MAHLDYLVQPPELIGTGNLGAKLMYASWFFLAILLSHEFVITFSQKLHQQQRFSSSSRVTGNYMHDMHMAMYTQNSFLELSNKAKAAIVMQHWSMIKDTIELIETAEESKDISVNKILQINQEILGEANIAPGDDDAEAGRDEQMAQGDDKSTEVCKCMAAELLWGMTKVLPYKKNACTKRSVRKLKTYT